MDDNIAKKIRQLRLSLQLNQMEFAEKMNVTQATVSRWEKGSVPDGVKLAKMADLSGQPMSSFIDYIDEAETKPKARQYFIRLDAKASEWLSDPEYPREDWEPYYAGSHVDIPSGPRFGVRTLGPSMNQIYPEGSVLDCVRLDHGQEIRTGKRVIVSQLRKDGMRETTVKEYVKAEDGREWLVPRSHDPSFQVPVALGTPADGIEQILIIAVVVGSYQPE